ncbi:hypothetical protein I302_104604 [Kwoniella bestiolae CBS 10118]|uniref:Uncharacterized protein n=1 Tax=Kwoniella bestiolae CBS 10118 TaxID=1296100 RepID=A0A1B9GBQ2_9TREE|nr:hypothetical protein I302_03311 [Kwoniella bestiolae CBS 10118]OCF28452.1 hypothetical protein I302_03311 [Kwoniella bestiolae CBS 10118]
MSECTNKDKTLTHAKLSSHPKALQLHPRPVPCRGPWLPTRPYRPIQYSSIGGKYDSATETQGGYATLPESSKDRNQKRGVKTS